MSLEVRSVFASIVLLAVAATGCGPTVAPHLPVRGKVTVAGAPLTEGRVVFHADKSKGNETKLEPAGNVAADGSFELATSEAKGAPAGWYKVAVFATKKQPEGKMEPTVWLANMKYSDESASGLVVEVKPGAAADAYDFKLEK